MRENRMHGSRWRREETRPVGPARAAQPRRLSPTLLTGSEGGPALRGRRAYPTTRATSPARRPEGRASPSASPSSKAGASVSWPERRRSRSLAHDQAAAGGVEQQCQIVRLPRSRPLQIARYGSRDFCPACWLGTSLPWTVLTCERYDWSPATSQSPPPVARHFCHGSPCGVDRSGAEDVLRGAECARPRDA